LAIAAEPPFPHEKSDAPRWYASIKMAAAASIAAGSIELAALEASSA
jgi:hypothetical protein